MKEARLGNKECMQHFSGKTHEETFAWQSEE